MPLSVFDLWLTTFGIMCPAVQVYVVEQLHDYRQASGIIVERPCIHIFSHRARLGMHVSSRPAQFY